MNITDREIKRGIDEVDPKMRLYTPSAMAYPKRAPIKAAPSSSILVKIYPKNSPIKIAIVLVPNRYQKEVESILTSVPFIESSITITENIITTTK